MTGHIFVFNQGIVKLREYIVSGEMGKVHYAHCERTNLGPFRYDVMGSRQVLGGHHRAVCEEERHRG